MFGPGYGVFRTLSSGKYHYFPESHSPSPDALSVSSFTPTRLPDDYRRSDEEEPTNADPGRTFTRYKEDSSPSVTVEPSHSRIDDIRTSHPRRPGPVYRSGLGIFQTPVIGKYPQVSCNGNTPASDAHSNSSIDPDSFRDDMPSCSYQRTITSRSSDIADPGRTITRFKEDSRLSVTVEPSQCRNASVESQCIG